MSTNAAAQSLMDNLEFISELETMDGIPLAAAPTAQLLDRVCAMDDGFVPGQPGLRLASGPAPDHAEHLTPDRNAFHAAPIDDDERDDETSVTISARVAAFAVTASALAGVAAAALVFHDRLGHFLR